MTSSICINMNITDFTNKYGSEYISSRSNPRIVAFSKLADKKYRDEQKLFLAEGVKLAEEALTYTEVECILISESAVSKNDRIFEIADVASAKGVKLLLLSDSAFEKITTERAPQGVIAVVKYLNDKHISTGFLAWQDGKRLMMLDGIRDPGNLGTILRSCEALGIGGIVLHDCADLYNNKTVRAAMGTLFRLTTYSVQDGAKCVKMMRDNGRRVLGAALGEHVLTLGEYETLPTDCPIIGNEGHGISRQVLEECTALLKIPMSGETESLNAAQAAACILWEYRRNN